ncbi:MAG: hypothetical protein AAF517_11745, partial [Planctomycetota bacterium]
GTAFGRATDATCQILDGLKRGSEISVINMGGRPTSVFETPIFDALRVKRQLRERDGGYGAASISESFAAASAILSKATHAQREVVLVSDFQSTDWLDPSGSLRDNLTGELAELEIPPDLTFFPLESPSLENVSLQSLDYSRAAIGVGQTLKLRAHLKNHSAQDHSSLRLTFWVDGKKQATSEVTLKAFGSSQVLFTQQFERAGSHLLRVSLDFEDGLATDNQAFAAVSVLDRIDVLLVDGDRSSEPLKSETDFLSIALTPFTAGKTKLSDLVRVTTVEPGQIGSKELSSAQVVILANIARLGDGELDRLSDYVTTGGSLLLFPGDKTDINWHNETLSDAKLLPMHFGPLQGHPTERGQQSRILAQHFDHPALQLFNDRTSGNLSNGVIRNWYSLKPADDDERPASTIARLADGSPFMVEKVVQDGVVLQAATACDADWSNLPTRPFFLPLMQEIVVKLATRVAPPRNIQTGDPLIAILPVDADGDALTVTTPDKRQATVRATKRGDRSIVEFAHTQRPGVYTVTGAREGALHFVSSTAREESNLAFLSPDQVASLAEQCDARVVRSVDERTELESLRRNGREIWRYLWFAVLALLFLEVFLQQKFAGKR